MESKNIGILTLPFEPNYGWILQLWATCCFLKKEGYCPAVVDRRWNDFNPSLTKDLKRRIYYNMFCRDFTQFYNREFNHTKSLRSSEAVSAATKHFDTLIVGSDQIWRIEHTRGADLNFFLDFASGRKDVKRIAYAASFGNDQWAGTPEETQKISSLLRSFDMVSVREESGVQMCYDHFSVDARHVLDPTMLISAEEYKKKLQLNERITKNLTTYLLDNSLAKHQFVQSTANKLGLSVIDLYPKKRKQFSFYKPVKFWLESIMNAERVIVDSFHGMVFSIIFNKQFVVIGNEKRGMARFLSLLESLNLGERLIKGDLSTGTTLLDKEIDYRLVNVKLEELRAGSSKLLLDALKK